MDRIREAVLRARVAQPRQQSAGVAGEARDRFHHETPGSLSGIREVRCDFDRFVKNRIISNENDPVLAAYRVLRTRVLQKMDAEGWRSIAIVSPSGGAGKTVTAINLAIAIGSKRGARVTLVDLDFYRPSIARYLGLTEIPSILDYFEGNQDLRDSFVRPDLPDILLLANERVSRRGAEFLTSSKTDELIERSTTEFGSRIVIFDISPLLGCDDAIAFLPKVDCALLIAASGQTRVEDLKEARRLLGKTRVIGAVLNKAPIAQSPSYYY